MIAREWNSGGHNHCIDTISERQAPLFYPSIFNALIYASTLFRKLQDLKKRHHAICCLASYLLCLMLIFKRSTYLCVHLFAVFGALVQLQGALGFGVDLLAQTHGFENFDFVGITERPGEDIGCRCVDADEKL